MTQQFIAAPLGLIDADNLKAGEAFLFSLNYEMFSDYKVSLFIKDRYLVVHTIYWSKLKKCWRINQEEFPLEGVSWIVESLEYGFLKPSSQGGLSDFDRSLRKEFNGELIGVNAMAHCCGENLPGFNVWNANRINYISEVAPQQWDIPCYMILDEGLLGKLKTIAAKYQFMPL